MGEASDEEERYRINPFDWETEFPEIIKPAPAGRKQGAGGFDVVIVKPPYGASFSQEETTYLLTNFKLQNYQLDSYLLFIEKDDSRINYSVAQQRWKAADGNPVNLFERPEFVTFSDKLKAFPLLDNICVITQGAKPFQGGKGKPPQTRKIVDEKPFVSEKKQNSTFRPLLRGSIIQR